MLKVSDLKRFPGIVSITGNSDRRIQGFCSISDPKKGHLTFCKEGFENYLSGVHDCVVIILPLDIVYSEDNTYIVSTNPRLLFARILDKYSDETPQKVIIHPTASIGENVHIEGQVQIGKNVRIQPHCTIGITGFGLERDDEGRWVTIPQIGGVVIEDDVEIASMTNIHRGTLDNTTIGRGCRISIHCNVGHNCIIGKYSFLAGKTNLGGKTKIGDYCYLGMGTITKPGVVIGNNVMTGMGSMVIKDIPDGVIAYGNPAKVMKENLNLYK